MEHQLKDFNREWYASARSTAEYVGQVPLLEQVRKAIGLSGTGSVVFYLEADGGVGKTRFLEEILLRLQDVEKWRESGIADEDLPPRFGEWRENDQIDVVVPRHVLDFYHLDSHTIDGFIQILYFQYKEAGVDFGKYEEAMDDLYSAISKLGPGAIQVNPLREVARKAFIRDLNNSSKKIVMALDTSELLTYESNVVGALKLEEHPDTVAGWLVPVFLPQLKNSVIMIAGRENESLFADLSEKNLGGRLNVKKIELEKFSPEESKDYFMKVGEAAKKDSKILADRINDVPEEYRLRAHYIAGGHPLYLALILDAMVVNDDIPGVLVDVTPEQMEELKQDTKESATRKELRQELLQDFIQTRQRMGRLFRLLALARRGLGTELLAWHTIGGMPSRDDVNQAAEELLVLLEDVKLSVIKVRDIGTGNDRDASDEDPIAKKLRNKIFFLQDVVAELYLEQYGSNNREMRKGLEIILKFYTTKIEGLEKEIRELQDTRGTMIRDFEREDKRETEDFKHIVKNIEHLQDKLHRYKVERIYYKLKNNAYIGFQDYAEYFEDTFQNSEPERWFPARDIVLDFASKEWFKNDKTQDFEGIEFNDIRADVGFKRLDFYLIDAEYEHALGVIEGWRNDPRTKEIFSGPFAETNLRYQEAYAKINMIDGISKAENLVLDLFYEITNLKKVSTDKFDEWRADMLLAKYCNIRGYYHRSKGQYKTATEWYKKSARLWRSLRIETMQANTLTNWALALMETGKHYDARNLCVDGLNLRQELGSYTAIAYSLNTLGIIDTRSGAPASAIMHIDRAISIFAETGNERGLGLAYHAQAEAHRRYANMAGAFLEDKRRELLLKALGYAETSVDILEKKVRESFRLPEALIELGCVYRELVRVAEGEEDKWLYYTKSEEALRWSEKQAHDTGFDYRAVDAAVNRGWLYYFYGVKKIKDQYPSTYNEYVDKIENLLLAKHGHIVAGYIGDDYLIREGIGPIDVRDPITWYWVQLGKADLLLGLVEMTKYDRLIKINKEQAYQHLDTAAKMWTLSFAYDLRYAPTFRDFENGKQAIYEEIRTLNDQEINILLEGTEKTIKAYGLEKHKELGEFGFKTFVKEQLGFSDF